MINKFNISSCLSHRERVPEGWVRGSVALNNGVSSNFETPHPRLRPTFSLWEKKI